MFAQLAGLGLTAATTMYGMNQAGKSADAAAAAAAQAAKAQEAGYDKARRSRKAGVAQSLSYLQPYQQSGWQGQDLLNDALGINGPEAQQSFFANFQNDPGFNAMQQTGINTVEQSRASAGGLRSGATMKALQDYGMKLQQSVFQDRMMRLGEVGKLGATAGTNMATLNEGANKDIANLLAAEGLAKAGGITNASNAMQMGSQNQLQLLGYGLGQSKGGINDLFKSFGSGGSGFSSGIPSGVGLGGYAGSF